MLTEVAFVCSFVGCEKEIVLGSELNEMLWKFLRVLLLRALIVSVVCVGVFWRVE